MMAKYLEGPFGEKSSKRLLAVILITLGSLIGIGSVIYGLFYPIPASKFIHDIFETFIIGGVVIELGTVADILKLWINRKS